MCIFARPEAGLIVRIGVYVRQSPPLFGFNQRILPVERRFADF